MENSKKKIGIYPGQVFIANHYDNFTGEFLKHLFLCIYTQRLNDETSYNKNVKGLLLTSKEKDVRNVFLSKKRNPILKSNSYCLVENEFVFQFADIKVIGSLHSEDFLKIVIERDAVISDEHVQCLKALKNMKAYETKREASNFSLDV